jgi:pyruvate/2-oxoglutarate/acetoin dehydrogenase E1 component
MALRGLRPVVEIMFGDFVTLIADQVINHIAKFRWMYNEQVRVPLVIRTPMGGRRGYGPTHSQTLEKLFLGVPGLTVLAPTNIGNPGELLCDAILKCDDPVLFVENKLLYQLPVWGAESQDDIDIHNDYSQPGLTVGSAGFAPGYVLKVRGAPSAILTICAYGYMAELARQAMLELAYRHEIFCELVIPTQLAPFEAHTLVESLRNTGRLLVVEEGTRSLGWGAEILARCAEDLTLYLRAARRLAAKEHPIPASPALEASALPDIESIITSCLEMTQHG